MNFYNNQYLQVYQTFTILNERKKNKNKKIFEKNTKKILKNAQKLKNLEKKEVS